MRRPPIPVALAVALLALSACGSPTQSTPEVDAVHPGAVAMGATSYVTVSGSGFDPSFSVDPATGQPAVDDGFTVTFAGQQSPEVSWRSPTTLVAALPAGLAAGTATVGVTAPDGGHGEKADALCVGAPATRSRLSIVYHGTLAIPTAINVESTPVGGGTATVLATGAGAQGLHPFAVSPDGRTVVYLHTQRGTTRTEQLIALHPQGSGVGILLHTEVAQQGKQVMDGFAFSPDSGTLVYVIDQRKLVAQDIPTDGGTAKVPWSSSTRATPAATSSPTRPSPPPGRRSSSARSATPPTTGCWWASTWLCTRCRLPGARRRPRSSTSGTRG